MYCGALRSPVLAAPSRTPFAGCCASSKIHLWHCNHDNGIFLKVHARISGRSPRRSSEHQLQARAVQGDAESVLNMGAKYRRRALLWWPDGSPHKVLIVKKQDNDDASDMLLRIGEWLTEQGLDVLVEERVHKEEFPQFPAWSCKNQDVPDFCVTLGGDGTVLHSASLFPEGQALPPVIAFAMGTLGFLTPFEVANFKPLLTRVIRANMQAVFCTLRTRLLCEVFSGEERVVVRHAFNEACIDRGLCLNFLLMDAYIDGSYVTTIQGDGLIVATPSGSTAYSMSAGGPMVAPSVPCMIVTPIAPLSLSFRPVVVAETSDIVIHIPSKVEDECRIVFDGKNTHFLKPSDSVRIGIAKCPLPMITAETMDQDWFASITKKLMWNATIKRDTRNLPINPPMDCTMSTIDEGVLNAPSCVVLQGNHHHAHVNSMGQDIDDVEDGMPVYVPNGTAGTFTAPRSKPNQRSSDIQRRAVDSCDPDVISDSFDDVIISDETGSELEEGVQR